MRLLSITSAEETWLIVRKGLIKNTSSELQWWDYDLWKSLLSLRKKLKTESNCKPIGSFRDKPNSVAKKQLVTAKYKYYSFLTNVIVLIVLTFSHEYFQNGVPLFADKLHVPLTNFEILGEDLLGKCSKHLPNILLDFLCHVRTVDMNFVFLHTLQVKIMRV